MKHIKRKSFFLIIIILMSIYFFSPKIIFLSSKKYIKTYSYAMLYINGHDQDGEPTLKQMLEYRRGTTIYSIMKSRDHINFPFLYANEISSILIGGTIYNLNDCVNKDKSEIKKQIRRGNIEIQHESEMPLDTANFENVYIKKYPWSKKRLYQ